MINWCWVVPPNVNPYRSNAHLEKIYKSNSFHII